MFKAASLFAALGVAAACLSGCANGQFTPTANGDITSALAVGCPILATVQALNPKMSSAQKSAAAVLALACPPNPAPTSAMVAVADVIQAYTLLQPLLAGK